MSSTGSYPNAANLWNLNIFSTLFQVWISGGQVRTFLLVAKIHHPKILLTVR
uniref:Uncharacterized protein n=1 Tax=Arundo donax TaxID=35708 RepID=A0A0A9HI95_ARUDO